MYTYKVDIIICLSWLFAERNNLAFIETSALDSTNVELAFTNILTGNGTSLIGKHVVTSNFIPQLLKLTELHDTVAFNFFVVKCCRSFLDSMAL